MIKLLNRKELNSALSLVWKVFCQCEAVNYPESGKQEFWEAIHSEEYLNIYLWFTKLTKEKWLENGFK